MSEKYSVAYSPEAVDDLRGIYGYIRFVLNSPIAAENQTNRIRERIRSLDTMPLRYPVVDWEPWHSLNMRKSTVNNYIIYYLVDEELSTVSIVRIFYGGQDIKGIVGKN